MIIPSKQAPMTRKEISVLSGHRFSEWQIKRHEKAWGLDRARVETGTRRQLFRRSMVLVILRNLGVEV